MLKHYAASVAGAKLNNGVLGVATTPIIGYSTLKEMIGRAHEIALEQYPKSDGWLSTISIICLEDNSERYNSEPDWGYEKAKEKFNG